MLLPKSKLKYRTIENSIFSNTEYDADKINIFIGISGYETRSRYFIERRIETILKYEDSFIFGYNELDDEFDRSKNDLFFRKNINNPKLYNFSNANKLLNDIQEFIRNKKQGAKKALNIDIDISSMPRKIYCNLPITLEAELSEDDTLQIWYSIGEYNTNQFPTAGISTFETFSGSMSISPVNRTHLIGLGFDTISTEGILNVFDPRFLITYYTMPAATEEYGKYILNKNRNILKKSNITFSVPYNDFEKTLSQLISICKELVLFSDVCIIPGGPKSMTLISSLVPIILGKRGVVCFHVNPNRSKNIPPKNTIPSGEIIGLKLLV